MNLTIKTRLISMIALTSIFIAIIGGSGLLALKAANEEMGVIFKENMVGVKKLAEIARLIRENRIQLLLSMQHDPSHASSKLHDHPVSVHLDLAENKIQEIDKVWETYTASLDRNNAAEVKLADDFKIEHAKLENEGLKPCIAAVKAGDYDLAVDLTLTKINPLAKEATKIIDELDGKEYSQAENNFKKAEASYIRSIAITVALVALTIIIAALISFFVIRGITRSSNELAEAADRLAGGDLTIRIKRIANDEMGRVGQAFNAMVESIASLIGQVAQTSGRVATAATQVYSTSEQMATGAEEVASQAATVATASEEMSATSNDIALNCSMAAESSRHASQKAEDGAAVVEGTVEIMNQIADRVQTTSVTIASLGERSDQIGEIIGTIEDIADQTNLLALNAAIEAARAGDQGRGFAVVADEVRALAERTTRATREIGEMIKGIQNETRAAVSAMEEGVHKVEYGRKESARSGEAIQSILQQIGEVTMQINQIATAAEEQTATTSEISNNMMQITEVVQGTARGAHESSQAASQLNSIAEELQVMVRHFKLS
ncbi:MAG: methyl-accepting chemotaxis protein [Desulfobacteraceae bacterium]|nr:methyl-accepting chemotaxis protein [Desulfobacteraceae bacterium]